MAIDERQLKKIGEDFWDIAPLVSLEWRYRASAEHDHTYEYVRTRPLLAKSYEIDRGTLRNTWRLHGEGHTNKDGVAEIYLTDFMRADWNSDEPESVVLVATPQGDEPVVLAHSVSADTVDVNSAGEVSTIFTATVRAWGLDGSPKAVAFSWHATVDTSVDPAVIGG